LHLGYTPDVGTQTILRHRFWPCFRTEKPLLTTKTLK
jgi:hypothetical protein